MIENEREAQILKVGFESCGLKVIPSKANYRNYVLALQLMPDLIILEIPKVFTEQLHIVGMLRKHRHFKTLPIIGYGSPIDKTTKNTIVKSGVNKYLDRTLKFTELMTTIEQLLKPLNKTIDPRKKTTQTEKDKDLVDILNPDIIGSTKLDLMVKYVSRLLAFPFTINKVLQITNDEKSGASQLARAITVDPAITAHLLRIANSVFFASANRRISSIRDAIVRIGFRETKRIVTGMLVMKLFDPQTKNLGFDRVDFWYHSLAAGLFAERVSKFMGDVNPEEAFLAGLLHDIGIIIFDEFFPSLFATALEAASKSGGHFPDHETAVFGLTHNDLVERLFPAWKMPQDITTAIINHYKVDSFKGHFDSSGKKLALCVSLGNLFAKYANIGQECDQYVWPVDNWVFEQAHMGNGFSDKFIEEIAGSIEQFRTFLGLDKREYTAEVKSREDAQELTIGLTDLADQQSMPFEVFLNRKGYETFRLSSADPSKKKPVSIVIVWSDNDHATTTNIQPYCTAIKKAIDATTIGPLSDYAPLLLVVPPEFKGEDTLAKEVSCISNRFDLREFERQVDKVISGQIVRVITPVFQPKPVAQPAAPIDGQAAPVDPVAGQQSAAPAPSALPATENDKQSPKETEKKPLPSTEEQTDP
jgi:HD-like signal output (HDOD) protein